MRKHKILDFSPFSFYKHDLFVWLLADFMYDQLLICNNYKLC